MRPRFGSQRVRVPGRSPFERLVFLALGVIDPAHYLHFRYVERMLEGLPSTPKRILDAGCGRGDFAIYLAQRYPHASVRAIDLDSARVSQCERAARAMCLENLDVAQEDLCALADSSQYDLIVSVDVLEHVPRQSETIRALHHALREGGVLLVHIPTSRPKPVLLARFLEDFEHWADKEHVADDLTSAEVLQLLTECGLEIIEQRPTFGRETGELAVSLFNLFFRKTSLNRVLQGLLALPCRLLALMDLVGVGSAHYALAVVARRRLTASATVIS